jgi:prolyl-tRNA editing enzyme YbaK/EbsC (Cys-tRNA(Pro) deacylase)
MENQIAIQQRKVLQELRNFLENNNSNFEILAHNTPIISTQDAAKYFDIDKAAPTFIMDTEQGLVAFIISSKRGKVDFKAMKQSLGFSKLKMADRRKVQKMTGYATGTIPLIGHNLPCVFDDCLLDFDYIYGGSGNELHTLKIVPNDVIRLNNIIKQINKEDYQ